MSSNHDRHRDLPLQAGDLAEHYQEQGYCCSEAILLAAAHTFAPHRLPTAEGLGGGLCGGMGDHKATCGVFTGGAVALGLITNYQGPVKTWAPRVKELAAEYRACLQAETGGHICEDLLRQMGEANADRHLCRQLTRRGAEILGELIEKESG